MPGLTCLSNVCVHLDGDGTGAQPSSMSASTNSNGEASTDDASGESTGRSTASSSHDSTSDAQTGGEEDSDGGLDESATVGGSDEPPPGCVAYAATYCGCLGEVAARDCTVTIADNCDLLYDWCPEWYACITGLGCNFSDYEAQCGTCEP